jgi:uncharacterized OB-fold protein
MIQRCKDCKQNIFYPKSVCPHCLSEDIEWFESSGKGTIYSYTVVNAAAPEAFQAAVPYAIGVIDLKEGVRMLSWIVDCDHEEIKCDLDVEVTFKDINDEVALPMFKISK